MYKGLLMSATVRKNFVFDQEVAMHLEELAKESKQSMTSLVQEMVEERYKSVKVKRRKSFLKNAQKIATGVGRGLLKDKSIQSIKAEMNV
jgi:hypothetical protein